LAACTVIGRCLLAVVVAAFCSFVVGKCG